MNHENIVKLHDHAEQSNCIYLLLEHAEGGTLFGYLNKHVRLDVHMIAKFFVQTCRAVEHVHFRGFIHRDLKPENILLDKNTDIKLCDFGWCASINDHAYRKVVSGTYEYMSPETLYGQLQGYEADIWSLGVLLYELHHNIEPFKGRCVKDVLHSIKNVPISFDMSVSPEAKDLIVRILTYDAKTRPNFQEIFSHPFVQKYFRENKPKESGREQLKRAQSFAFYDSKETEIQTRDNKDQCRKKLVREHSVQQPQIYRVEQPEQLRQITFSSHPISSGVNPEPVYFRQRTYQNRANYRPLMSPAVDSRSRTKASQTTLSNMILGQNARNDVGGYTTTSYTKVAPDNTMKVINAPLASNSFLLNSDQHQARGSPKNMWNKNIQTRNEASASDLSQNRNLEMNRIVYNCFISGGETLKPSSTTNRVTNSIRGQDTTHSTRNYSNKENPGSFSSMLNHIIPAPPNHLNMQVMNPWHADGSFASISNKLKEGLSTPMSINRSTYLDRARQMAENKSIIHERDHSKHMDRSALERTLSEINQNHGSQGRIYQQKSSGSRVSAQERGPYLTNSFSKPLLTRQRTNIGHENHHIRTDDHVSVIPYRSTFTLQ